MSMPNRCSTSTVPKSDSGIAMTEMTVVRNEPRKRNRMTMTNSAPSSSALPTLLTEVWMKSACLNICVSRRTSCGSEAAIACRLASICSVTRRVLIFGCLVTARMTAGEAFCDAVPIFTAAPVRTSATSLSSTGWPPLTPTSVMPNCSMSVVRAMPRRTYSLPKSRMTPPAELRLMVLPACSRSLMRMPYASIFSGSARIWYCL